MTTSRHFPTFHAILRACASPRGRALVRALTSPHRVWFWTTTFPVLLAPLILYLVMRPGVWIDWSTEVGAVTFKVVRSVRSDGSRYAVADISWPGGGAGASCLVPVDRLPMTTSWRWAPGNKHISLGAHWFRLSVGLRH